MSYVVFDFTCTECGHRDDDRFTRRSDLDNGIPCPECTHIMTRLPAAPRVDWNSLAMGDSASPEAIRHWEKKRRDQKKKEEKTMKEHGDYGPNYSDYGKTPG